MKYFAFPEETLILSKRLSPYLVLHETLRLYPLLLQKVNILDLLLCSDIHSLYTLQVLEQKLNMTSKQESYDQKQSSLDKFQLIMQSTKKKRKKNQFEINSKIILMCRNNSFARKKLSLKGICFKHYSFKLSFSYKNQNVFEQQINGINAKKDMSGIFSYEKHNLSFFISPVFIFQKH